MDTTLFDKIICAISSEKELKANRKLLAVFLFLLAVSLFFIPFSTGYLIAQWRQSGISYFMGAPFLNISMFFHFWQDFLLSIIEAFPIAALILFAANISLLLFAFKLSILWKKKKK